MNYKPIYEFLLWDNCNNNCKFCFQRDNPRLFNKEKREYILSEVIKFIESDKFIKGSHILVVGGEIFDKPSDKEILKSFFKNICKKMVDNTIELLYINTNLIYSNTETLYDFLELVKYHNLYQRVKFTTSYDLEGRFKTKEDELLMLNNLKQIKVEYPELRIVTNTILTKETCRKIINKEFNLQHFMEEYKCWDNLLPYIVHDKTIQPSRAEIFKALRITDMESFGYLDNYINNMSITQEKWLYMYKNNDFQFCSCDMSECGHSVNFKRYSDKGTCFCCDLKEMFRG